MSKRKLKAADTAEAAPVLLEVTDIHVAYGKIRALNGVSITVQAGEIVTLIGANGAGKSTTVRTIAGLLKPAAGTITLEGRDLGKLSAEEIVRAGVALSPEGRLIFPRMSVYENLLMGAYVRRDQKAIETDMARVFELFPRLAERRTQTGGTLSGGEQQMLAIGRALMARPRLLLLDEPSLGLAPVLTDTIFEVLAEINRQGTTILLIEQNALRALHLAHRGYVLETGSVVYQGSSAELLKSKEVQTAYLGI
jgi:branched-chain amino acid transport system ATP-binding protein